MGQPLTRKGITQRLQPLIATERNGRNFVAKNFIKTLDAIRKTRI